MSIPDFQSLMLPLLNFAADGEEKSVANSIDHLAKLYNLTLEDLEQLLPSKTQKVFANRAQWAKSYLKMAGLVENTGRGYFKITPLDKTALKENPEKINIAYLNKFPGFKEKRNPVASAHPEISEDEVETDLTPEENIEQSYKSINAQLAQEILQKVKDMSPAFFEKLVVDLLVKMGYGGSIEDAGKAVGKSGDEGIDGVIKEDRLGLDAIYIQAKRYKDISIGRPEIQKFVGALAGQSAKKGVFLTTSFFTKDALDYVKKIDYKIVLIDGGQLAQYMIEYNLGVSTAKTYVIKNIDLDYFGEE